MFAIKPVTITGVLLTTVLVVSSANGQGFGGLIDKAKAKAAQVTANRATGSVGLVGLDDSGHPHTIHPEDASTPAKERALVQAIINDPKPGVNEAHDGEEYKKIKAEFGFSPIYTADDGFFTKVPNFKNWANYYIGWIDHVSEELRLSAKSPAGAGVRAALPKIKQIHFVGTGEAVNRDTELEGWKYAFNRSNGMLTIYFNDSLQTWDYNHSFSKWVAKNVS